MASDPDVTLRVVDDGGTEELGPVLRCSTQGQPELGELVPYLDAVRMVEGGPEGSRNRPAWPQEGARELRLLEDHGEKSTAKMASSPATS